MPIFSYWLIPAEPFRSELLALMLQLARRFGAVEFEPHVTIYSGPSTHQEAESNIAMCAKQFRPALLSPQSLQVSQALTKTFFIQFEPSSGLQAIHNFIKRRSKAASSYIFDPHVSLLYHVLPQATLDELACTTPVPGGPYRFDTLQAIASDVPTSTVEDIKRWSYLQRARLWEA
jgi:hypothetical protein